ncbi:MAG: hypothetical protein ACOVOI_10625 [Hyphomicrobiales bacterium]
MAGFIQFLQTAGFADMHCESVRIVTAFAGFGERPDAAATPTRTLRSLSARRHAVFLDGPPGLGYGTATSI